MELEDLKMLAAASLMSGSVFMRTNDGGRTIEIVSPTDKVVTVAVEVAQKIWDEVCKQR